MIKRTLLGALLMLVLVGEPAAARATGLFTLPGFLLLFPLYILLFLVYEALTEKYALTNMQVVLLNFAIYAVFITGFLHGEIADYALHPENNLVTTLIRIQSSCFVIFAFPLLAKMVPKRRPAYKLPAVIALSLAYILLLTPSRQFGLIKLITTVKTAPGHSIVFAILAILAIIWAVKLQKYLKQPEFVNRRLFIVCIGLAVLAGIPSLASFLILLVAMPLATLLLLRNRAAINAKMNS